MLIELVRAIPGDPWLAEVRTPLGPAVLRWGGEQAAEPGDHHVEWTVDEDVVWGQNTRPAAASWPALRSEGDHLVLRGRLTCTEDGAALLDLGDTSVLLGLADPLPEGSAGAWVELRTGRDQVVLHPYRL